MQKNSGGVCPKGVSFWICLFKKRLCLKNMAILLKYLGLPGSIFERAAMAVCLQANRRTVVSFYPFYFSMDFSMLNGFLAQDFENARPDCRYGFGHPRTRNFKRARVSVVHWQ